MTGPWPPPANLGSRCVEAMAEGETPAPYWQTPCPSTCRTCPAPLTFGEFADQYIASVEDGWKSPIHRQQWRSSLRDHAGSLLAKPLADISTDDVLAVLEPIWLTKAETAKRCEVGSRRSWQRPWRASCAPATPSTQQLARAFAGVAAVTGKSPATITRRSPITTPRRLWPTAQSHGIGGAMPGIHDPDGGSQWGGSWRNLGRDRHRKQAVVVPGDRMKAGAEHIVPLSEAAMAVLDGYPPAIASAPTPSLALKGPRASNMAMAMLLRVWPRRHSPPMAFAQPFAIGQAIATDFSARDSSSKRWRIPFQTKQIVRIAAELQSIVDAS